MRTYLRVARQRTDPPIPLGLEPAQRLPPCRRRVGSFVSKPSTPDPRPWVSLRPPESGAALLTPCQCQRPGRSCSMPAPEQHPEPSARSARPRFPPDHRQARTRTVVHRLLEGRGNRSGGGSASQRRWSRPRKLRRRRRARRRVDLGGAQCETDRAGSGWSGPRCPAFTLTTPGVGKGNGTSPRWVVCAPLCDHRVHQRVDELACSALMPWSPMVGVVTPRALPPTQ
mgnify:CR=1 FL=1